MSTNDHVASGVRNIDVFALTDCGYLKENNEDSYFLSEDGSVLAVADGIGGEPYGEVASALAVQAIERLYREEPPSELRFEDHAEWIERAFDFANETIYRHAERDPKTYGMGTTLVAAVATADGATIGSIGDSRAIVVESFLRTITRDHVELPDPSRRRSSSARQGGLTRRLGNDYSVTPDIFTTSVPPGAWLILCTDGLHGVVSSDEILADARSAENCEHLCETLLESALQAGGPDNITIIAWRNNS